MNNINQIYLRNIKNITKIPKNNILISGNIDKIYYFNIPNSNFKIHSQNFCYFENITSLTNCEVFFRLLMNRSVLKNSNLLIYFWPKSKVEALFQLEYMFSLLPKNSIVFIFGENNSGINCSRNLLKKWISLKKIDSARHCSLYRGKLIFRSTFKYSSFIKFNKYNNIVIKTIPSVFSYNKIDNGTKLLISTFSNVIKGKILDVGCGSGILSVFLAKLSHKVNLTLIDSNIAALKSSKLTLSSNNIKGIILKSNVYSNVNQYFDLIISNPPIHENFKINLYFIKKLIIESVNYLNSEGELRIVVIKSISVDKFFKLVFNTYKVIKENKYFRVYQAKFKNIINKNKLIPGAGIEPAKP